MRKTLICVSLLILALMLGSISIVNGNLAYEDFTTYTEVEPDNHIQKTATHIDFLAYRNTDAYVYQDKGVDHFGDFEHLIDAKFPASADEASMGNVWAVTKDVDDFRGLYDASKTALAIRFYYSSVLGWRIDLFEIHAGSIYGYWGVNGYAGSANAWYYLKITKSGIVFSVKIYSDSVRTDLLATFSWSLQEDHRFQYIFASQTWDEDQSLKIDLDVENLSIGEMFSITFYNNAGGMLKVNGTTVSNGTSKIYELNELIELSALVQNSSYRFQNFTWNSNYNETNPHNLTIVSDLTLWCYFDKPSTFTIGLGSGFILAFILSIALLVVGALAISRRRS